MEEHAIMQVHFHSFLASALDGNKSQLQLPLPALFPGKEPPFAKEFAPPQPGWTFFKRRKSLTQAKNQTAIPWIFSLQPSRCNDCVVPLLRREQDGF
jgi:hypothetical protein